MKLQIRIVNGADVQLPEDFDYAAIWEPAGGGTALVDPVGFALGPDDNVAGAAFCPTPSTAPSTVGVVVSATRPSFGLASSHFYRFSSLVPPKLPSFDWPIEAYKSAPYEFVVPRVQFSKDCRLALVYGADLQGAMRFRIEILDLQAGAAVTGSVVTFNETTFSAEVIDVSGRRTVRIRTGTRATDVPL